MEIKIDMPLYPEHLRKVLMMLLATLMFGLLQNVVGIFDFYVREKLYSPYTTS